MIAILMVMMLLGVLDMLHLPKRAFVLVAPFLIGATYGWITESGSIKECIGAALGKGFTALLFVAIGAYILQLSDCSGSDDWDSGRMGR